MTQAFIGAGGWGYFSGGLSAYARGFRFVELNASFYRRIPESSAHRWRSLVPPDFVFSMKAHKDISHSDRLRGSRGARAAFSHDLRIARVLRAPYVILETPASLEFGPDQVAGLHDLAAMVPAEVKLGLEARAHRTGGLPATLQRVMVDERIMDVVDLSRATPRVANEDAYGRLFGPGPHNVYEFDDDELRKIDRADGDSIRTVFTFHGVRMYKDAARFLTFKKTGAFPPATSSRGVASLEEVLRPDARFPSAREDLVRDHGWKVIDVDDWTRAHAAGLLATLPERTFSSVEEVVRALAWQVQQASGGGPPGPGEVPPSIAAG